MKFLDALKAVRESSRPVGFSDQVSPAIRPVQSVIQQRCPGEAARRTETAVREAARQYEKAAVPALKTSKAR